LGPVFDLVFGFYPGLGRLLHHGFVLVLGCFLGVVLLLVLVLLLLLVGLAVDFGLSAALVGLAAAVAFGLAAASLVSLVADAAIVAFGLAAALVCFVVFLFMLPSALIGFPLVSCLLPGSALFLGVFSFSFLSSLVLFFFGGSLLFLSFPFFRFSVFPAAFSWSVL